MIERRLYTGSRRLLRTPYVRYSWGHPGVARLSSMNQLKWMLLKILNTFETNSLHKHDNLPSEMSLNKRTSSNPQDTAIIYSKNISVQFIRIHLPALALTSIYLILLYQLLVTQRLFPLWRNWSSITMISLMVFHPYCLRPVLVLSPTCLLFLICHELATLYQIFEKYPQTLLFIKMAKEMLSLIIDPLFEFFL